MAKSNLVVVVAATIAAVLPLIVAGQTDSGADASSVTNTPSTNFEDLWREKNLRPSGRANQPPVTATTSESQNASAEGGQTVNLSVVEEKKANENKLTAESHSKAVEVFVQNMLTAATLERQGLGDELKRVVMSQDEAEATTIAAISKLEKENWLKRFFIGPDYKTVGVLRTEAGRTRERLAYLEQLRGSVRHDDANMIIANQINDMGAEQSRLEAYIKAKDGQFSLFGWLVKWFA